MKIVNGIIIGGIAAFLIRYVYNLKRAENKTAVALVARVHKLTTQGVELHVDYNIKNPSASAMEMAIPLIKLYHKGTLLASSSLAPFIMNTGQSVSNDRVQIGAHSETGIITSRILIPYLSMIGLSTDLFKALKDRLNGGTQKVKMDVEVNTTIFTNLANIPYDDRQTIEI
ncbi:MAG: hypothetical protein Crog4KO_06670 [Crocinitomicaceae bacterium]